MSALQGQIPRALPDHRSREARVYRLLIETVRARLPSLPASAGPMLREIGLVNLDLMRLRADLEALRARRGPGVRRQEERRLCSEIRKTRVQLMLLERRVEELAGSGNGHEGARPTPSELLEQMREHGELGNGDE